MKLEKIIEKTLPKPSSFLPGKLASNMIYNMAKAFGEDTQDFKKTQLPKTIQNAGLNIGIEFCRWVPTAMTAYGKDDWSILYALVPYVITTYFLDRISYYGIAGN